MAAGIGQLLSSSQVKPKVDTGCDFPVLAQKWRKDEIEWGRLQRVPKEVVKNPQVVPNHPRWTSLLSGKWVMKKYEKMVWEAYLIDPLNFADLLAALGLPLRLSIGLIMDKGYDED